MDSVLEAAARARSLADCRKLRAKLSPQLSLGRAKNRPFCANRSQVARSATSRRFFSALLSTPEIALTSAVSIGSVLR